MGRRRVLLTAPTGSGKTVIFSYIIRCALARGSRVLVLVHRVELVAFGVIAAEREEPDAPVMVATVATIGRRLNRWRDLFDLIVVDEAHHAVAGSWAKVQASQPRAKILGVTATAERLDGRGLGEVFNEMVLSLSSSDLRQAGFAGHLP